MAPEARAALVSEIREFPCFSRSDKEWMLKIADLIEADGTRIADLEAKRKSCCICAADD